MDASSAARLSAPVVDPAGNLPRPLSSFVGRDRELAAIAAMLDREGDRLLTLLGPGGVGKTRLAIEAARASAGFPHGRWFIDLVSVRDSELVLPAIARALDLQLTGARPLTEQLAQALAPQSLLLVLDNMEHVLDAAPDLAFLLDTVPGLAIIATSRAPLHLTWERLFTVGPLSLHFTPDRLEAGREALAQANRSEAVQLFVQRAQAVRHDFTLSPANAWQVMAICDRVDGLPLAIELAAARTKILSPAALLARLAQQLQLLTGGPADLPDRLRSMRAAIAWSAELLSADDATLFQTLAVFAGSVPLDGAVAVTGIPEDQLLDRIAALVDLSLIQPMPADEDLPRFRLLESVREYGLEQLDACAEAEDVRRRHAAWVAALTNAAEPHFSGSGEAEWTARMLADLENVRAAVEWAVEAGETDTALCITGNLWSLWSFGGQLTDGHALLERVLALPDLDQFPETAAAALSAAGLVAWTLGDMAQARRHHRRSLEVARALNDPSAISRALMWLSQVAWYESDYPEMIAMAEASLAAEESGTVTAWTACAQTLLGIAAMRQKRPDDARAALEQAERENRAVGFDRGRIWTLQLLADLAHEQGDAATAARWHATSLPLAATAGNHWAVYEGLAGLSLIARDTGHLQDGTRLLGAADRLRKRFGVLPRAGHQVDAAVREDLASRLGAEPFAEALAEGALWDTDRAVTAALALAKTLDEGQQTAATAAVPAPEPDPFGLTPREREVLALLVQGQTDRDIADTLFISHGTARTHVQNILQKMEVRNRAAAVTMAYQHGLV